MRTLFTLLVLLAFYTQGSIAQRPWIFAYENTSSQLRLTVVSDILYSYSENGTAYSIDHGRTWVTVGILGSDVHAMADFVPGVSLAIWHGSASDSAKVYFTSNGTTWSLSESLWLGGGLPSCLTAHRQKFYIGTSGNSGKIFVRGTSFDSIAVSTPSDILDLVVTDSYIAAATTAGIQVSTDDGLTWTTTNPPQTSGSEAISSSLLLHLGDLLAPSTMGVYKFDASAKTWSAYGVFPDSVTNHNVRAMAGDPQRLVVLVPNDTNHLQMYRLPIGDTAWIPTAYPLPHANPDIHADMLCIDNGWAVTHQTAASSTDSLGIYQYDLNDFTSVHEIEVNDGVTIGSSSHGITIETPFVDGFTVTIYDLLGNTLYSQTSLETSSTTISTTSSTTISPTSLKTSSTTSSPTSSQILLVLLRTPDGRIARRLIMQ